MEHWYAFTRGEGDEQEIYVSPSGKAPVGFIPRGLATYVEVRSYCQGDGPFAILFQADTKTVAEEQVTISEVSQTL